MTTARVERVTLCGLLGIQSEGRVFALPEDVMMKVSSNDIPVLLAAQFPGIGTAAVYGGIEKQPFEVLRKSIGAETAEGTIMFELHLGELEGSLHQQEQLLTKFIAAINTYANRRGWFVNSYRKNLSLSSNHTGFTFVLSPDRKDSVNDLPSVLYHLTDAANLNRIKSEGLKPKAMSSRNRSYPGRVYVFASKKLLDQMIEMSVNAHREIARTGSSFNTPLAKTPDMVVLSIDSSKLRRGTKFFNDVEFDGEEGAMYTYTHIPAESIIGYNRINALD